MYVEARKSATTWDTTLSMQVILWQAGQHVWYAPPCSSLQEMRSLRQGSMRAWLLPPVPPAPLPVAAPLPMPAPPSTVTVYSNCRAEDSEVLSRW